MNSLKAKEYLKWQRKIFKSTMAPEMLLAINKAISALGKQVPKKPIDKEQDFGDRVLSCPNCLSPVTNYYVSNKNPAYCQFCGQALDWRD